MMPVGPEPMDIGSMRVGRRGLPWYAKVLRLFFIVFCFEIGVILIVFPWLRIWEMNNAVLYAPWLADVWGNPFFRGALSGLGLINVYISFLEILRLFRGEASRPS